MADSNRNGLALQERKGPSRVLALPTTRRGRFASARGTRLRPQAARRPTAAAVPTSRSHVNCCGCHRLTRCHARTGWTQRDQTSSARTAVTRWLSFRSSRAANRFAHHLSHRSNECSSLSAIDGCARRPIASRCGSLARRALELPLLGLCSSTGATRSASLRTSTPIPHCLASPGCASSRTRSVSNRHSVHQRRRQLSFERGQHRRKKIPAERLHLKTMYSHCRPVAVLRGLELIASKLPFIADDHRVIATQIA